MNSTNYPSSRHRSRLSGLPESQVEALTRNLEKSYYEYDEAGRPVPKTAAGALYTAAAYLQSTKPPAGDPNAELHRQQIKALAMAAKALNQGQVAPVQNTTRGVVITPQSDNHTRHHRHSRERKRSRDRRSRSRSRRSRSSDSYSDREPEQNGAKCFTRSVREARMPKGFKLTSEQPKYNGKQE